MNSIKTRQTFEIRCKNVQINFGMGVKDNVQFTQSSQSNEVIPVNFTNNCQTRSSDWKTMDLVFDLKQKTLSLGEIQWLTGSFPATSFLQVESDICFYQNLLNW